MKPDEMITKHADAIVPLVAALIMTQKHHQCDDELVDAAVAIYNTLWNKVAEEYAE